MLSLLLWIFCLYHFILRLKETRYIHFVTDKQRKATRLMQCKLSSMFHMIFAMQHALLHNIRTGFCMYLQNREVVGYINFIKSSEQVTHVPTNYIFHHLCYNLCVGLFVRG